MRGVLVGCLMGSIVLAPVSSVFGQWAYVPLPQRHNAALPEVIRFFAPFFFPKVIQDVYQLKDYIVSEEFALLRERGGDLDAVDDLFDRALALSWDNVYEALLITLCSTMDHRRIGINIPLLGPLLWIPLTSEFEDEFDARVSALPRNLYADTPAGRAGDRDKLQHFFGSAFLTYVFESREVADRIGGFIELGEESAIVGGTPDERDFRTNWQGQEFGIALHGHPFVRPSEFLMMMDDHQTKDSQRDQIVGAALDSASALLEER